MDIDKTKLLIENETILLRPLRPEDVDHNYVSGINDPQVNQFLVDVRLKKQTLQSIVGFVDYNWKENNCILFGIFYKKESERLIGTTRASGINWYHHTASLGICIFDKTVWKKGLGIQAVQLVKQFLFDTLSLHYIEAGAYAKNQNSVNMFERAGFQEAYRVKEKFRLDKTFEEVVYLSAINNAFDHQQIGGLK